MPGWEGIWPVAPTPFLDNGEVDHDGMRRVLDCMIDQGSTGICILANFSEQFLLSYAERESLTRLSLEHVAGRVPVLIEVKSQDEFTGEHTGALGAAVARDLAGYTGPVAVMSRSLLLLRRVA